MEIIATHTQVKMYTLEKCVFHNTHLHNLKPESSKRAMYDARIPIFGQWAYLCKDCFDRFHCKLGLGHGQELVYDTESKQKLN